MKAALFASLALLLLSAGCSSPTTTTDTAAVSVDSEVPEVPAEQIAETDVEPTYDVALKVPKMNCPFACWPKVKETLEHQPGVALVTLAKQEKENAIDNPTVYLKLSGEFSADDSIAALGDVGFDGASVSN